MVYFPDGRGVVTGARRMASLQIDDSGTQQLLRKLRGNGELPEDVPRYQDHGFSSHPPVNSEGLVVALGGRSDRLIGLGFQHKDKRPKDLPAGGVALYDADGKLLKFVKDETVFDAGGKPFTVKNATKIKIEGTQDVAVGVAGCWVRIVGGKVHLGVEAPDANATPAVMTDAGPSTIVFAKV